MLLVHSQASVARGWVPSWQPGRPWDLPFKGPALKVLGEFWDNYKQFIVGIHVLAWHKAASESCTARPKVYVCTCATLHHKGIVPQGFFCCKRHWSNPELCRGFSQTGCCCLLVQAQTSFQVALGSSLGKADLDNKVFVLLTSAAWRCLGSWAGARVSLAVLWANWVSAGCQGQACVYQESFSATLTPLTLPYPGNKPCWL